MSGRDRQRDPPPLCLRFAHRETAFQNHGAVRRPGAGEDARTRRCHPGHEGYEMTLKM